MAVAAAPTAAATTRNIGAAKFLEILNAIIHYRKLPVRILQTPMYFIYISIHSGEKRVRQFCRSFFCFLHVFLVGLIEFELFFFLDDDCKSLLFRRADYHQFFIHFSSLTASSNIPSPLSIPAPIQLPLNSH